jgi:hypothetical protein
MGFRGQAFVGDRCKPRADPSFKSGSSRGPKVSDPKYCVSLEEAPHFNPMPLIRPYLGFNFLKNIIISTSLRL